MSGFSSIAPPSFNGDNYPVWVVKMRSFLKAMNLWEYVESDVDPPSLGSDPTLEQIKKYEEDKAKKHKALTFNQMRLYDEELTDQKVVEKIMISVPDQFEAKITAIEESCDLKKLTIAELISKLQAQEQRASIRVEGVTEGAGFSSNAQNSIEDSTLNVDSTIDSSILKTKSLAEECFARIQGSKRLWPNPLLKLNTFQLLPLQIKPFGFEKILKHLGQEQSDPTVLWCGNKLAIAIASNPVQHGRTKHINVKFHSIKEAEKNIEIKMMHCRSEEQLADIMTKHLPRARFEVLREILGVSKKTLKELC
ncbi:hypothetical protein GH714_034668 [Hevea brasiliensis]|uniref:DUF4219 domain-containing protein n=1 Tax=Hevea brasiliensis TaxID=3981 RepID=A0A6A6NC99_HEVBR|nr:hypothetical protein GH714_034668 [Hevea brasiliensis]